MFQYMALTERKHRFDHCKNEWGCIILKVLQRE